MSNSLSTSANFNLYEKNVPAKWIWYVILGLTLLFFGFLSFGNLVIAARASVLYVGAFMVIGGILQMTHSFRFKGWPRFIYLFLSGLIFTFAGIIAFIDPLLTATMLTLALSVALMTSGLLRIWCSFELQSSQNYIWLFLSGLMTLMAGILCVFGWPNNTVLVLGLILAFDLTLQGIYTIVLGLSLRSVKYV